MKMRGLAFLQTCVALAVVCRPPRHRCWQLHQQRHWTMLLQVLALGLALGLLLMLLANLPQQWTAANKQTTMGIRNTSAACVRAVVALYSTASVLALAAASCLANSCATASSMTPGRAITRGKSIRNTGYVVVASRSERQVLATTRMTNLPNSQTHTRRGELVCSIPLQCCNS